MGRPSPAMVVATAALAVALGGVAFATIPDSTGTFHGCVAKASGNLRVVEGTGDCRSNERPIAWNQQGSPAGSVVARIRLGPTPLTRGAPEEIPLPNSSWTQSPDEFQRIELQVEFADFGCAVRVSVFVDGDELVAGDLFRTFGFQRKVFVSVPLFEPAAPTTHTLRLSMRSDSVCTEMESLKVDVLGFR